MLAKLNKMKNFEYFAKHSALVKKPEQTDVVISETLGCFALEENIIETMNDAKRFLKAGGALMPHRLRQFVSPVVGQECYDQLDVFERIRTSFDLNFQAVKRRSLSNLHQMNVSVDQLYQPKTGARNWDTIDFYKHNLVSRKAAALSWRVSRPTMFYGFCLWWEADLAPGIVLSTSPLEPPTHWQQAFAPLVTPLHVMPGHFLQLDIASNSQHETGGAIVTWNARAVQEQQAIEQAKRKRAPR